ncbi:hypothetical protein [Saccharothrix stipae]
MGAGGVLADPEQLLGKTGVCAADILARNPQAQPDILCPLFNDNAPAVRAAATHAISKLHQVDTTIAHKITETFTNSHGFDDHFETLFHALQDNLHLMPEAIITASEQAVRIAGTNLGDISTRHAAASRDIVTTVVRLYRQGNQDVRRQCLDIIDSLCEANAFGITDALDANRTAQ